MIDLVSSNYEEKCTLIETIHGEVKLIKRSYDSPNNLETFKFSNLKDCWEYVDKNKFQVNIIHSGKRKSDREKE
jgi:hypothetical protein